MIMPHKETTLNDLFDIIFGQNEELGDVANKEEYVPYQRKDISGEYTCIKNVGSYKRGHVFDSRDGWVHGVWSSSEKRVVEFIEEEYFEPCQDIDFHRVDRDIQNSK